MERPLIFDSHAHYDDERFDADREALLASMADGGVGYIMNCGASVEGSRQSIALAEQYDFIYASVGVHPEDAQQMTEADLETIRQLAAHPKVRAIGEIGLDYHYEGFDKERQQLWLCRQMELAEELGLPVIIHERDAKQDCLDILRQFPRVHGVMHCFSGNVEIAKQVLQMGYYISFSGVLTFKNSVKAAEVAKMVPADRYLIETDCPYMAPVPHRGERNSSLFVVHVAEKLAELRGISVEEAIGHATENTKRLFGITE